MILKLAHSKNQNQINNYFTNFNNYLKTLSVNNLVYGVCFIAITKTK